MSFSPRNVSELIVAMDTGAVGSVGYGKNHFVPNPQAVSGDYENKVAFIETVTTNGVKISGKIKPQNVTSIIEYTLKAGSPKVATVTFTDVEIGDMVSVTIDVHDGIGSPLNDRFINAYFIAETTDAAAIAAGVGKALADAVKISGDNFVITYDTGTTPTATTITVTEGSVTHKPGWNDGFFQPWDVQAKYQAKADGTVTGFEVTYVEAVKDDLVQAKNIEWFNSGYSKDPYREMGYPASFDPDSNIVAAGVPADAICTIIQYYDDRDATNVERQHKQLIVIGNVGQGLHDYLIAKKA